MGLENEIDVYKIWGIRQPIVGHYSHPTGHFALHIALSFGILINGFFNFYIKFKCLRINSKKTEILANFLLIIEITQKYPKVIAKKDIPNREKHKNGQS